VIDEKLRKGYVDVTDPSYQGGLKFADCMNKIDWAHIAGFANVVGHAQLRKTMNAPEPQPAAPKKPARTKPAGRSINL
jgi:hypothetical protein